MREGGEASDKPIDSAVLSRMKQFRAMNKLKKLALKVGFYSFLNQVTVICYVRKIKRKFLFLSFMMTLFMFITLLSDLFGGPCYMP